MINLKKIVHLNVILQILTEKFLKSDDCQKKIMNIFLKKVKGQKKKIKQGSRLHYVCTNSPILGARVMWCELSAPSRVHVSQLALSFNSAPPLAVPVGAAHSTLLIFHNCQTPQV